MRPMHGFVEIRFHKRRILLRNMQKYLEFGSSQGYINKRNSPLRGIFVSSLHV